MKMEVLKMKNEELSLNEIITYAKQKTAVILSSLILSVIGIIVGGIFLLLEGLKITDSKIGFYAILLFLISMATSIVLISHYEKMRSKLINKMDTKSFSVFFDYFTKMKGKKKDFVYYEIKDIFMYGLWQLKDKNPYLKEISEQEEYIFDYDSIKTKINKEEFLASSMFRCLTFRKNNVLYRNQIIFLNQEKFIEIIQAYEKILLDKDNHLSEYIRKCYIIEKKYSRDKENAIKNYEGLAKNIGIRERFVNFSSNQRSVRDLKKIFAFIAIVALVLQNVNADLNRIATIVFNVITIVLLLVDVSQRDDEDILH